MAEVSKLENFKGKAAAELKRFLFIAGYVWLLLTLFEIHRYFVLRQVMPAHVSAYRVGFAGINALVLGKVIATGEILKLGKHTGKRAMLYSVLLKSALFAALLVVFQIVEDLIKGLFHGKTIAESFEIPGGDVLGMVLLSVMLFAALIPLFLFTEVQESIGKERLRTLMFETKSRVDAA